MHNLDNAEPDLKQYAELLLKWSKKINLIANSTYQTVWDRHIQDSVQLFHVKQDWTGHHVDLGSGGGLPGIIIAILAKARGCDLRTTLVESDRRKAVFLQTVIRELRLSATVLCARIETAEPQQADILTARALSNLPQLLEYSEKHRKPDGVSIFPKGAAWQTEVDRATLHWKFEMTAHQSATNAESRILKIGRISRV
ncbi:MAG: 16S rRNA (guanine(527)-N(7))-methyltransferase RsmG [Primorskyibacter sp.]